MKQIPLVCAVLLFTAFSAMRGTGAYASSGKAADEARTQQGYDRNLGFSPEFALRDLDKNIFTLSNYRGKESVILLFWTTWCPNCREGIRQLNEMYPLLLKENFEVLSINVGESGGKVARFVKANNLRFKVLLDSDTETARSFKLIGVPTYVIIDKNGHVRFYDHYFPKNEYKQIVE